MQQQLDVVKTCIVIGRVGGHGVLQLLQRSVGVAFGQGVLGFLFLDQGFGLFRAGHVFVEEFAHLAFGQRALEAVHGLAVDEQDAGRDAADAKRTGQLLLLVGVDLHQLEAAFIRGFELFQDRAEGLAGRTPRRPEVHQHGRGHGGGNDLCFKVFNGHINHGRHSPGAKT